MVYCLIMLFLYINDRELYYLDSIDCIVNETMLRITDIRKKTGENFSFRFCFDKHCCSYMLIIN